MSSTQENLSLTDAPLHGGPIFVAETVHPLAGPYFTESGAIINEGIVLDIATRECLPTPTEIAIAKSLGKDCLSSGLPQYAADKNEAHKLIVSAVRTSKSDITPNNQSTLTATEVYPKKSPVEKEKPATKYPTLEETIDTLRSTKSKTKSVIAIKDHLMGCDIENPDQMLQSFERIYELSQSGELGEPVLNSANLLYTTTIFNNHQSYKLDQSISAVENWSKELLSSPIYGMDSRQLFMAARITDFHTISILNGGSLYLQGAMSMVNNIANKSNRSADHKLNGILACAMVGLSVCLPDVQRYKHKKGTVLLNEFDRDTLEKHRRIVSKVFKPNELKDFEIKTKIMSDIIKSERTRD